MHQFTESLHSKPHRQGACVFNNKLPPALLAEWPGSFMYYCGVTVGCEDGGGGGRGVEGGGGGTDTDCKSQRRKLTLEKKLLPPLRPELRPGAFRWRGLCSHL